MAYAARKTEHSGSKKGCGDCAGTFAAGELVHPGATAHDYEWRVDSPFVGRIDVRVPDAASGDADV
ncbi:MAG: hypothetical protein DDT18_02019 [Actinobacteria bacterium]|nr:hypothetical protein [Actinomycetota bacterium]